jgi:hypothetical protein
MPDWGYTDESVTLTNRVMLQNCPIACKARQECFPGLIEPEIYWVRPPTHPTPAPAPPFSSVVEGLPPSPRFTLLSLAHPHPLRLLLAA